MTGRALSLASPQDAFVYGRIIDLVRTERAVTRPALERETGLGRKLIAQRVLQAIDVGLLEDGDVAPSEGGRPSRTLRMRRDAGVVCSAVISASEMWAAVADLDGVVLDSLHLEWISADRPHETLVHLDDMFARLGRRTRTEPWAYGIGIAGPVDFATGTVVEPPIMPGWDGFNVRAWMRERHDAPVWVDNDVNVMALGEWHRGVPRDEGDLLYVLLDTGVGAGLVSNGAVFRGHRGAAGDIGHIRVTDDPSIQCRCGRTGCLEAVSGGWGLVREMTRRAAESPGLAAVLARGDDITPHDIGRAAAQGDPVTRDAVHAGVRVAARTVADLVSFVNPATVVLGGGVLRSGPEVVEIFTDTIVERTTHLARRDLAVRAASLDFHEGVTGAAILAIEQLFLPSTVGLWIENGTPVGHAALLHRAVTA